jgi:hypothetical protein
MDNVCKSELLEPPLIDLLYRQPTPGDQGKESRTESNSDSDIIKVGIVV